MSQDPSEPLGVQEWRAEPEAACAGRPEATRFALDN